MRTAEEEILVMYDTEGIFARLGKISKDYPEGSWQQKTIFQAMIDLADGYENTYQLKEILKKLH